MVNYLERGDNMREKVTLVCTVCLARNYKTTKSKLRATTRLEISKYCATCKQHTLHKESK